MRQLDGIRGLAALAVVFSHSGVWFPVAAGTAVLVFFVLSGFLITGILLQARDRGGDWRSAWWNFFGRRALRIFPIYYLTLAVAFALDLEGVRAHIGWYASYTTNLPCYVPIVLSGAVGHYWSLAVEEQFYLIWPFLVLLVPPSRFRQVVPFMIGIGVMSALLMAHFRPGFGSGMVTTTCFLPLGVGAWLALDRHEGSSSTANRFSRILFVVGAAAFMLAQAMSWTGRGSSITVMSRQVALSAFAGWLIARAGAGLGGLPGRILASRPLLALGMISYGIYVYHFPILHFLRRAMPEWGAGGPNMLVATLLSTLLISALSYYLLESPLLQLKDRLFRIHGAPGAGDLAGRIRTESRNVSSETSYSPGTLMGCQETAEPAVTDTGSVSLASASAAS